MLPKAFLVLDSQRELGELIVALESFRKRMQRTDAAIAAHRKAIENLRRRVTDQGKRLSALKKAQ